MRAADLGLRMRAVQWEGALQEPWFWRGVFYMFRGGARACMRRVRADGFEGTGRVSRTTSVHAPKEKRKLWVSTSGRGAEAAAFVQRVVGVGNSCRCCIVWNTVGCLTQGRGSPRHQIEPMHVALDLVTGENKRHASISANLCKTRVFYYEGGPAPPRIADLASQTA